MSNERSDASIPQSGGPGRSISASTSDPHEQARAQVLIVEDEIEHAEVMADALRKPGHICTIVNSAPAAIEELRHGTFDIIVTDLRMPNSASFEGIAPDGADAGIRVLKAARTLQPQAETIMVTAHGDVPTARAAFKEGAYDFIEKPLDLATFRALVNRAASTVILRHESGALGDLVQHEGFAGIIAGSETMRNILRTVKSVSASMLPVLVTGESGTGKELIAQAIHKNSPRGQKRFVALNCAAEAENLLEDQLFGHVRGAFTGADKDREGIFEYCTGGTIFLDEIGDMPLKMQAKLLRVLETGDVVRLGSNDPRKVDVRLVSATNKDLKAMIDSKEFRGDLYFRIKGAHIHLPPLRDRREDIPRIVRHAIAKAVETTARSAGRPAGADAVPDITDAALMRLTSFSWPGNVRQLLNVVQNMVVTAASEPATGGPVKLDLRHVPDEVRVGDDETPDDGPSGVNAPGSLAGTTIDQLEKRAIRETLLLTGGNREQAAKLLGMGERTLYRKLKKYGLG